MTALERVGYDELHERDLFVLDVQTPADLPEHLPLPSSRFVCLVAWDCQFAALDDVSTVARRLLNAGAVYVCAWGPGCERLHDMCDEEREALPEPSEAVVMTTWHDNEPLTEVLWFVLTTTPDEAHEPDCTTTVGISIGSRKWASEIRDAFSRPSEFVAARVAES